MSLVDDIRAAGVAGAGGAGFPTHVKAASHAEIVIANGAECEPLLQVDSQLMERFPSETISGLNALMMETGAEKGIIALKKKYQKAFSALEGALEKNGLISIKLLNDEYPAGDEHLLVPNATGRRVPEGGIPLDVGVLVQNIQTLLHINDAAHGEPVTDRYVTVAGAVKRPGTFRAPLGTPFSEIIEAAGGATEPGTAVISGGPMMGKCVDDVSEPLTKTTSGLIVLPGYHSLILRKNAPLERLLWINRTVCCQCTMCTQMCPRYLLGHDIQPHLIMRSSQHGPLPEHLAFAMSCSECGVCTYYACPMGISPGVLISALKKKIQNSRPAPEEKTERPSREMVRVPGARLTLRLGLGKYDKPAPLQTDRLKPTRVTLRLKQHLGKAATPVVREGVKVETGELLADIPEGALAARVHASITGTIERVTENEIVIQGG